MKVLFESLRREGSRGKLGCLRREDEVEKHSRGQISIPVACRPDTLAITDFDHVQQRTSVRFEIDYLVPFNDTFNF
jgi:hypothetical protein